MSEVEEALQSWSESAQAWITAVESGDRNRDHLLDRAMLDLAGSVEEKSILDVGCGEGRFCRMLSERGAQTFGIDPTQAFVDRATQLHPEGEYRRAFAEALPFASDSFDLVVAYLTLIDIPDFRLAIAEMARVLRTGGKVIVSNVNSFASTSERAWYQNDQGKKLHVAVNDYFDERSMRLEWSGMSILNWHRPLEAYMTAFIESGLILDAFSEPRPSMEAVERYPEMMDEYKVPLFVAMRWRKG